MKKSLPTILSFLVLITPLMGSADDDKLLNPDNWPVTVENTVKDILAAMTNEDKQRLKGKKKEDLILYHHGWGTGIRNYYGLWRGNDKLIESACGRPCHPDDASMLIIEAVWQALQN